MYVKMTHFGPVIKMKVIKANERPSHCIPMDEFFQTAMTSVVVIAEAVVNENQITITTIAYNSIEDKDFLVKALHKEYNNVTILPHARRYHEDNVLL